ncbi:MAG: PKD domain-containing protein [Bacteroidia bacterium]|jgi:hypothetical protein
MVLSVIGFTYQSKAIVMIGAELTYKCIDASGNYKVSLVYYRDCAGIPACSGNCSSISNCSKSIQIKGADAGCSGQLFFSAVLTGKSVRDVNINTNPYCTASKSICDNMGCVTPGTFTPGVERYEFEGLVNLGPASGIPSSCCNVALKFEECCRHGNNVNIIPANFYTEVTINRCLTSYPNCNSPILTNDAYNLICTGQGFFYNFGGFDPDFDSLAYSFTPALGANGASVTYVAPYTYNVPLPYSSPLNGNYPFGLSLDKTGTLKLKPNAQFFGTVAIKTEQWRKVNNINRLVGTTLRDILINVKNCAPNNPPTFITDPPGSPISQPQTDFNIYTDSQFCFTIIAKDTDNVSDTTYMNWNQLMANYGATFTPNYNPATRRVNGPAEDSYSFCWKPHDSLVRDNPYGFVVKAIDNKCPIPGVRSQQFQIKVLEGVKPIQIIKSVSCDQAVLSHSTVTQAYSYKQWLVSKVPGQFDPSNVYSSSQDYMQLVFNEAGKYPVQLVITVISNGLTKIFYDTLVIQRAASINMDTILCAGGVHDLTLKLRKPDSGIVNYQWFLLPDLTNPIGGNPSLPIVVNQSQSYVLIASDSSFKCEYSDTFHVHIANVHAAFEVSSNPQQCLKSNQYTFLNTSVDSANNLLSYVWKYNNATFSTLNDSVSWNFSTTGLHGITLIASTTKGCRDSVSKSIRVLPDPTAHFSLVTDTIQCLKHNSFKLNNGSAIESGSLTYTWHFGDSTNSNLSIVSHGYVNPGDYSIRLIAKSDSGCVDTAEILVKVLPGPKAAFTVLDSAEQCFVANQFKFLNQTTIGSGTFTSIWQLGEGDISLDLNPIKTYNATGAFQVNLYATSNLNCKDTTTKTIKVFKTPQAAFQISDSAQCVGIPFNFSNTSVNTGDSIVRYKWMTDNDIIFSKDLIYSYAISGYYLVQLIVTNRDSCSAVASKAIEVFSNPQPMISGDSLAMYFSTKTYSTTFNTGSAWYWRIKNDSAHTANANNVVVNWSSQTSGEVVVVETNLNGCVSDTVKQSIYLTPQIIGIGEMQSGLNKIVLYPQPAEQKLFLLGRLENLHSGAILSTDGKIILYFNQEEIQSGVLDISKIQSGMYLMQFRDSRNNFIFQKVSIIK